MQRTGLPSCSAQMDGCDHGPVRPLRASRGLPGSLSPHKKLAHCEMKGDCRRYVGQIMSEALASGTAPALSVVVPVRNRSEERRVGKECRARVAPCHEKEKTKHRVRWCE